MQRRGMSFAIYAAHTRAIQQPTTAFFRCVCPGQKGQKSPCVREGEGGKGKRGKKEGEKRREGGSQMFLVMQQRAAVWTASEPWANSYAIF